MIQSDSHEKSTYYNKCKSWFVIYVLKYHKQIFISSPVIFKPQSWTNTPSYAVNKYCYKVKNVGLSGEAFLILFQNQ